MRLPEHLAVVVGLGLADLLEERNVPAPLVDAHDEIPRSSSHSVAAALMPVPRFQ